MSNNDHDKYANYLIFSYYTGSPISAHYTQHVYMFPLPAAPVRGGVFTSPPLSASPVPLAALCRREHSARSNPTHLSPEVERMIMFNLVSPSGCTSAGTTSSPASQ